MKMTMSESCSMLPDSRRSERIGRLSWRCSTARDSCDIATIGTSRSRASTFRWRELPRAQALRFDLRLAAHEPLRDLLLRHLEREQRDRRLVTHGEVRGHAQ